MVRPQLKLAGAASDTCQGMDEFRMQIRGIGAVKFSDSRLQRQVPVGNANFLQRFDMFRDETYRNGQYLTYPLPSHLLQNILDQYNSQYLSELKKTIDECKEDAVSKLNRILRFNAFFGEKNIDIIKLQTNISHELDTHSDFELNIRTFYRKQQNLIAGVIKQGIQEKLIPEDLDPQLAALTLVAFNDGIVNQYYMNRYHLDNVKFVKVWRQLIMDGLKKR